MKKVRATATGFYKGARIYAGQAFAVPEDLVGSWFQAEGVEEQPRRRGRPKKADQPDVAEAIDAENFASDE